MRKIHLLFITPAIMLACGLLSLSFPTEVKAAPYLVYSAPSSGAVNVDVNTDVSFKFNERIAGIKFDRVPLDKRWGSGVWNTDHTLFTMTRIGAFAYNAEVKISFTATDIKNNSYSGNLYFKTASEATSPILEIISPTYSKINAGPLSVPADGSSEIIVTVFAMDGWNNPLPNRYISLSSTRGTIDNIKVSNAYTANNGSVTFLVSSRITGASTFSAIVDGNKINQTATVTFTEVKNNSVSSSRSDLYASKYSVENNGSSYARITVVARNSNNEPLNGKFVYLVSNGGLSYCIKNISTTTDNSGVALFDVSSRDVGSITFSAYIDGIKIDRATTISFYQSFDTTVNASKSWVRTQNSTLAANGYSNSLIVVTAKNNYNTVLSGKNVTLYSSRGSTDTIATQNSITNSSGVAYFTASSLTPGNAYFTAVIDGIAVEEKALLSFSSVSSYSNLYQDNLFKEPGSSAVYYYAKNGKRYVFPNQAIYFSWYKNFDSVKTVPSGVVKAIPFGGNVLAKPGTSLVQFFTIGTPPTKKIVDPKVYAITENGQLRWIRSASAATSIFGKSWKKKIVTVPEMYKNNYANGVPGFDIYGPADYDASYVKNRVTSISSIIK